MLLELLVPELQTVSVKCYHLLVLSFEFSVVCCIQMCSFFPKSLLSILALAKVEQVPGNEVAHNSVSDNIILQIQTKELSTCRLLN